MGSFEDISGEAATFIMIRLWLITGVCAVLASGRHYHVQYVPLPHQYYPQQQQYYLQPQQYYFQPQRYYLQPQQYYPQQQQYYLQPQQYYLQPQRYYLQPPQYYPQQQRYYAEPQQFYTINEYGGSRVGRRDKKLVGALAVGALAVKGVHYLGKQITKVAAAPIT